jgi:hypothetical protein
MSVMGVAAMARKRIAISLPCVWALALLLLAGCSQAATLGQTFILREGKTARITGTRLRIEAEQVYYGMPGSQKVGDGAVVLQVKVADGEQTELFLQVGWEKSVGEYTIRLERLLSDADGVSGELVVSRK